MQEFFLLTMILFSIIPLRMNPSTPDFTQPKKEQNKTHKI